MFINEQASKNMSLIIVCDEKDMSYANYLIQLIGQKDDSKESIVGIKDDSVAAAIFTKKYYKDNLPTISSNTHIVFIGHSDVTKEQQHSIEEKFCKYGMHYGWLGKRAVLYIDDTNKKWMELKDKKEQYMAFLDFSKLYGNTHPDALANYAKKFDKGIRSVMFFTKTFTTIGESMDAIKVVKVQQYTTLINVFYQDGLKTFLEG